MIESNHFVFSNIDIPFFISNQTAAAKNEDASSIHVVSNLLDFRSTDGITFTLS